MGTQVWVVSMAVGVLAFIDGFALILSSDSPLAGMTKKNVCSRAS